MNFKILALALVPILILVPIAYATVEDAAPEPEDEQITVLKDINNKLRKVVKATEIQENFVVTYTVTDLVLSCTPSSHADRFSLQHHAPDRHNHEGAMVWYDKIPQSGELIADWEYAGQPFHIIDIDMEDGYFTGRGVMHTYDQVCPDTAMVFKFDIKGQCDGSLFEWTTNDPKGFNATASGDGYRAVCLER